MNWAARFPLSLLMPFVPALFCAAVLGMAAGFALYQGFVFPGSRRPLLPCLRDFVMVNLMGSAALLLVAVAADHALLHVLRPDVAEAAAHALGIAAGAVINFAGHRSFTFAGPGTRASGPPEDGR